LIYISDEFSRQLQLFHTIEQAKEGNQHARAKLDEAIYGASAQELMKEAQLYSADPEVLTLLQVVYNLLIRGNEDVNPM